MAPKNRRLPAKKQVVKVNKKTHVPASTNSQESNIKMNIEEADMEINESAEKQYIEFEHDNQSYYIDNQAKTLGTPPQVTYEIYNDQLELSGHLKGNQLILLDHENLDQSQEIEIPLSTGDDFTTSEMILDGYLIRVST